MHGTFVPIRSHFLDTTNGKNCSCHDLHENTVTSCLALNLLALSIPHFLDLQKAKAVRLPCNLKINSKLVLLSLSFCPTNRNWTVFSFVQYRFLVLSKKQLTLLTCPILPLSARLWVWTKRHSQHANRLEARTFDHIVHFLSGVSEICSVVQHEYVVTLWCSLSKPVCFCQICSHWLLHQYVKAAYSLHSNLIVSGMSGRNDHAVSLLCFRWSKKFILNFGSLTQSWTACIITSRHTMASTFSAEETPNLSVRSYWVWINVGLFNCCKGPKAVEVWSAKLDMLLYITQVCNDSPEAWL